MGVLYHYKKINKEQSMRRYNFNSKKSPLNVNNNENEIDVNVLLNDPKSLHKMLNKKSDDENCKVSVPAKKKEEKIEANVKPPLAFFKTPKEKDNRSPLTFFKEEGANMLNNRLLKKEGFKAPKKNGSEKEENKKDNLINNFLNRDEFDNVRKELQKRKNKPKGKAVNDLNENPKFKKGAEVLRGLGY
jgi:hypothetical protein